MRCFIAAWPDDEARKRCAALTTSLQPHADHGRVTREENLHLTLAFIGTLDDALAPQIARECARLRFAPLRWQLDAIGLFKRPRVLWAGGPALPELEHLAAATRALLDDLAIGYDRKPFVPHVTLLRDVRRYDGPQVIAPPIFWPIVEVGLYRGGHDEAGARYARVAAPD